jgi:hypothetical protein|uniref:Uncharacterized protein n=1 Tax=Zea mays TaxID=4577 RepID=A0A804NQZ3_MAIZE
MAEAAPASIYTALSPSCSSSPDSLPCSFLSPRHLFSLSLGCTTAAGSRRLSHGRRPPQAGDAPLLDLPHTSMAFLWYGTSIGSNLEAPTAAPPLPGAPAELPDQGTPSSSKPWMVLFLSSGLASTRPLPVHLRRALGRHLSHCSARHAYRPIDEPAVHASSTR